MSTLSRIVAAVALVVLAGCSGGPSSVVGGSVAAPVIAFPSQVLGLRAAQEDVAAKLDSVRRPYVDSVAMFSLREDDLLRATLQVSRFNRLARPRDPGFHESVIGVIGGTRPLRVRVGDVDVWSTTSSKQSIYIWFKARGFFVLAVHEDFLFPRTLLRRVSSLDVRL